MTQDKARKAAIRARMARTGETYTQAARRLGDRPESTLPPVETILAEAGKKFGFDPAVLTLAMSLCAEADRYPLLPAHATGRVKVFLDTKDWVALAKARLGRPEYPHDQAAYDMLRNSTERGEVIVPLTSTTYWEIDRVSSLRQRTDLADVIAEISGFVTITGRSIFVGHQVRTALADRFSAPAPSPIDVFGLGRPFAIGDRGRFSVAGRDGATPTLPADAVRLIDGVGRVIGEYMMLRGPAPEELPELRALGYRPEEVEKVERQRVARERDLAARLASGDARTGHLADIVHARHLYWELDEQLRSGLEYYGIGIEDFFSHGKQWLTEFLDDIPSAAVAMPLTEKNFRLTGRGLSGNDVRDGDAMSAAVPYCDIVMTDKHVAAQLKRSPAVTRQGTIVLSRLRDLNDTMPRLIADRAA
jgi:hypothetical protein